MRYPVVPKNQMEKTNRILTHKIKKDGTLFLSQSLVSIMKKLVERRSYLFDSQGGATVR